MLIFLYGQDDYRLKEELRKIVEENKIANADWLDFIRIDANDKQVEVLSDLKQTADTISMFGTQKLIIIDNILEANQDIQEEILEFLKKRKIEDNKNTTIVFCAEKMGAESASSTGGLQKYLKSNAKCKEFKLLQGVQLKNWIKDYVAQQQGKIDSQAVDKLIEYAGNDLWRLSNELSKLIVYKMLDVARPTLMAEDVELLVRPEIDLNIFNLVDAIGYKDKIKAMKLFNQHLENGEDEFYILSMITYQFRNLIRIKSTESINSLGLHPFVLRKTSAQAEKFTLEALKKIYYQLMTIDFEAKIGKTDITTALELFISGL